MGYRAALFLQHLRKRPLPERRAIAAAAYLSSAAVVIAVAITSLMDTLRTSSLGVIPSAAQETATRRAGAPPTPAAESTTPLPPLAMLWDTGQVFAEGIGTIADNLRRLGHPAETPETAVPTLTAGADSIINGEETPPAPAPVPPMPAVRKAASALVQVMGPRLSSERTAELVAAEVSPGTRGAGSDQRLLSAISHNLKELGMRMSDAYRYLSGQ